MFNILEDLDNVLEAWKSQPSQSYPLNQPVTHHLEPVFTYSQAQSYPTNQLQIHNPANSSLGRLSDLSNYQDDYETIFKQFRMNDNNGIRKPVSFSQPLPSQQKENLNPRIFSQYDPTINNTISHSDPSDLWAAKIPNSFEKGTYYMNSQEQMRLEKEAQYKKKDKSLNSISAQVNLFNSTPTGSFVNFMYDIGELEESEGLEEFMLSDDPEDSEESEIPIVKEFFKVLERNGGGVFCWIEGGKIGKVGHSFEGDLRQYTLIENEGKIQISIQLSQKAYDDCLEYFKKKELSWIIAGDDWLFRTMQTNLEDLKHAPELERILTGKEKIQRNQRDNLNNIISSLPEFQELNECQKNAIFDCLQTNNYNIVLGMPGTGKTEVITTLLAILIRNNKKVLITAHTNSAVDNILIRFLKKFPEFEQEIVRVGSMPSVDRKVAHLIPGYLQNIEEKKLFAATCFGVRNKKLDQRKFDFCIVDEASQVIEPEIIGPLRTSYRFILFGDHKQMPPIVVSQKAQSAGLNISLFEKLVTLNENSISVLNMQYRMNQDIVRFSNEIIYKSNPMKCANSRVENGRIELTKEPQVKWVRDVLNPEKHVVFFDLEEAHQKFPKDKQMNNKFTCTIANQLIKHGMKGEDIGIISPLCDDQKDVQKKLSNLELKKIDSYTIDACQGIEKSCIIMNISLYHFRIFRLLKELKRVNVAWTRAKHKLIIVGSLKLLKRVSGINQFLNLLRADQIIKC